MSLWILQSEVEKVSWNIQSFQQIKEKFDTMIKENKILIEDYNWTIKVFIIINWKKYLVANGVYLDKKNRIEVNELVTANFHNYTYSDKLFDTLSCKKRQFIDKNIYLNKKSELEYLWYYMLYFLINLSKNKWYNLLKIMEPDDNAVVFYNKAWKLFEKSKIIVKYHLPKYEKFTIRHYINYQKVINIEI